MTKRKNFTDEATPHIVDTEYEDCNFVQPAPVDVGGKMQGVRLFPGDDTPRSFTGCNLVNAEPPPGSTLSRCNTTVKAYSVVSSTERVTVDGQSVTLEHHKDIIYGRFNGVTESYDYLPTPQEIEVG